MKTKQYSAPAAVITSIASADILTTSGIGLVIAWDDGEEVG